ncbi:T9SS type A sorting domain-containing protein [Chryseobacterium limigenitum]|uniref:Por secretion system C-terminal sorting domain-containing protein n=1 Tax=Chryseobacterium limigenitum TaxID=1612149 RepID=A0A1K2IVI9_9FLAO|nr:T9SS type A sorting domain-containing protein [Chryseobacterium limigenitum]SFZ96452.1 Por secretion system C-terminal sorting domain-containing protein [Chryseobacterium limigenitum]
MKKISILLSLLPLAMMAQTFTEVQTSMSNYYYPASDIGDIDNDELHDIVVNGAIDSDGDGNVDTTFNGIYKNNGTTFIPYADLGADATHLGDIKFIDYNNDGLADIISTGLSYMDIVNYKHYRFRNTGSGFVKEADLPGKIYGSMEVFDFNHDGLQDYALNGTQYIDGIGFVNKLDYYQNTGSSFQVFSGWMEGSQNSSFKMVDLNNDHLIDLVILGYDSNSDAMFKVYLNIAGTLALTQTLPPLASGKLEFADFNADGFQDVVVSAQDQEYKGYLAVLMNDGAGHLNIQQINTPEISDSSLSVGDLNNDGYYDFIVSGNDENNDAMVKVFTYNPSNQNFTENTTTGLYNLGGPGFVHLLDYNDDHHLDVLLSGFDWADPGMPSLTKIFKNVSSETNVKPAPPTNLNLTKNGNRFNFSWNGASDDKTPVNALRYEIKVGTTPGAHNLAKYVVTTPSWFLDLDPSIQNVYWSVRSIDASKVYSDASTENTLGTQNISVDKQFSIYPNPATERVFIKGEQVSDVEMYSIDGRKLNVTLSSDQSINVSHFPKGVYMIKLKIKQQEITKKLIIK